MLPRARRTLKYFLPLSASAVTFLLILSPLSAPVVVSGSSRGAAQSAPTPDEVRNATYTGLKGIPRSVTLIQGKWEDAASKAAVTMANLRVVGDLDGTPPDDAVVILSVNQGGTGVVAYLAVVSRRDGKLINIATAPMGDRVQLRSMRIENRRIMTEVVQAGPDDAMCCPGELATRAWELAGSTLDELPGSAPTSRLSVAALGHDPWVLRAWDVSEPAPASPEVTLQWRDGRLSGKSGCNSYSASGTPGAQAGDLKVGPTAGTRMMCADTTMKVERRYLDQFQHVTKYGFVLGQLALTYKVNDRVGLMLFDRK
jgi:heat shock protein HslJ